MITAISVGTLGLCGPRTWQLGLQHARRILPIYPGKLGKIRRFSSKNVVIQTALTNGSSQVEKLSFEFLSSPLRLLHQKGAKSLKLGEKRKWRKNFPPFPALLIISLFTLLLSVLDLSSSIKDRKTILSRPSRHILIRNFFSFGYWCGITFTYSQSSSRVTGIFEIWTELWNLRTCQFWTSPARFQSSCINFLGLLTA